MGCAILPHLKAIIEIIQHGLQDEQQKVRTITALAIAALAEAVRQSRVTASLNPPVFCVLCALSAISADTACILLPTTGDTVRD